MGDFVLQYEHFVRNPAAVSTSQSAGLRTSSGAFLSPPPAGPQHQQQQHQTTAVHALGHQPQYLEYFSAQLQPTHADQTAQQHQRGPSQHDYHAQHHRQTTAPHPLSQLHHGSPPSNLEQRWDPSFVNGGVHHPVAQHSFPTRQSGVAGSSHGSGTQGSGRPNSSACASTRLQDEPPPTLGGLDAVQHLQALRAHGGFVSAAQPTSPPQPSDRSTGPSARSYRRSDVMGRTEVSPISPGWRFTAEHILDDYMAAPTPPPGPSDDPDARMMRDLRSYSDLHQSTLYQSGRETFESTALALVPHSTPHAGMTLPLHDRSEKTLERSASSRKRSDSSSSKPARPKHQRRDSAETSRSFASTSATTATSNGSGGAGATETSTNAAASSSKAVICDYPGCGRGFQRGSELRRHQKIHRGERAFKCDVPGCTKTFTQRYGLSCHMRIHTGARPYKCEECEKRFADLSALGRHKATHTGERPFTCSVCHEKSFSRRATVQRHEKSCRARLERAAAGEEDEGSDDSPGPSGFSRSVQDYLEGRRSSTSSRREGEGNRDETSADAGEGKTPKGALTSPSSMLEDVFAAMDDPSVADLRLPSMKHLRGDDGSPSGNRMQSSTNLDIPDDVAVKLVSLHRELLSQGAEPSLSTTSLDESSDPVSSALSFLSHVRAGPSHWSHANFPTSSTTLAPFAGSADLASEAHAGDAQGPIDMLVMAAEGSGAL